MTGGAMKDYHSKLRFSRHFNGILLLFVIEEHPLLHIFAMPTIAPVWKRNGKRRRQTAVYLRQTVEKRRKSTRGLRAARIPIVVGGMYDDYGR